MRKLFKLAAGLALTGVAGYIVLAEGVAVVSADAVVNARVAVMRAPIDGQLSLQPRVIGERVQRGQTLGSLTAGSSSRATWSRRWWPGPTRS